MDKILIFIPAYNCEKQIIRVLGQLDSQVMKYITEVIVVNNRSTDNTEQVVKEYIDRHRESPIKLLRNHENYGLGGSHKVAFDYAMKNEFDYVITLHGDDQGDIYDFLPVLRTGYYKKHGAILGARFMPGSSLIGYSAVRTLGNIVYDFLFAFVIGRRVYDLGSGLNMYCVEDLKSRYYEKFPDNLMFNYCMVMALEYYNLDAKFYPVSWREDDQVSNVKLASQASKVLKMLWDYYRDPSVIREDYRDKEVTEYGADIVG